MPPRLKLPTIQVMRAVAAMMVVLGHSITELDKLNGNPGTLSPFYHSFGVSVFFVISGFIMVYTSEGYFNSRSGRRTFAVSRIARIVPIYWLLTTLTLLAWAAAPSVMNSPGLSLPTLLNSYLFIPFNNELGQPLPILGPGWSLDYEMYFYALFFAALFFDETRGKRYLVAALVAIVAIGFIARPSNSLLAFWSSPAILKFACGIGIAQYRSQLARLGRPIALLLFGLGVAGFVALHGVAMDGGLFIPLDILSASAVVAGVVALDMGQRSIAPPFLVVLGDASYSLYLSHMFVVRVVRVAWNGAHLPAEPILFCGVVLVLSCLVAIALWRFVEMPVYRWLRLRLLGRRGGTPAATMNDAGRPGMTRPAGIVEVGP